MKLIENIFKKPFDIAMDATKGKKTHAVVDAFETFIRTSGATTKNTVHIRDGLDTKRMMSVVIVALLPALFFAFYNIGMLKLTSAAEITGLLAPLSEPTILNAIIHGFWHLLPIIIVSYTVGLGIEFAFAAWRGHEVNEGFLVTGMLIPLIVPPDMPLWMIAVGTAFGVIIGKEVFGGTGFNVFNPALVTRAFLFFSYPTKISGDQVWIAADKLKEGVSGATPMGIAAVAEKGSDVVQVLADAGYSLFTMAAGFIPGSNGETSVIAIAIGALILLITKIASWRVMFSTFFGGYIMALVFNIFAGPESIAYLSLPPVYHLVMGGFAFGAVFMTTDPVSSSATKTGQLLYGFMIGALAILIRVANPAYPEGMMLAILFMNVFAPLIDHVVVQSNVKRRLARVKR